MRVLALILGILAAPASAHELWLEPLAYQIPTDGKLEADIVNGQNFEGLKLAYLPRNFANFAVFADGQTARVDGRPGDLPALNQDVLAEGLNVVAYQAYNSVVTYETWDKFQTFVDHKDLGDVLPRHLERGLPQDGFAETYSRYSKTLIGVGNAEGSDRRVGLETELVALTNPYTDDVSGGVQVQLYYQSDVRADEQVEVFEKAPDGTVAINLYRTDEQGIATIPVKPGHSYMADAVVLREASDEVRENTGGVWETLWANLTFAVPE